MHGAAGLVRFYLRALARRVCPQAHHLLFAASVSPLRSYLWTTMPGLTVPHRRRRSEDFDGRTSDDNVEETDGVASPYSQQSHGSKRTRLDDSSAPSPESEEGAVASPERVVPLVSSRRQQGVNPLGAEKHQPGSIIRVRVKNFVTYEAAEFNLGPSLNMIIGPNGTGKSSLVSAICMGLGWKPDVLGRASEAHSYIKNGTREAEIEVELAAGPNQRRNPIITRNLRKAGNKSSFTIDGRPATNKDVSSLAKSFNIHLDNLCQFLPQDRVVEFARQTPEELLASTQQAAAREEMTAWHRDLKKLGAERKAKLKDHAGHKDHLVQLQGRQNAQRGDVQRLEERRDLLEQVKTLRRMRPMIEYQEAKQMVEELKHRKQEAQTELDELKARVEPTLRAVNAKETYKEAKQKEVEKAERMAQRCADDAARYLGDVESVKGEIVHSQKEREAAIEGDRKRKQDVIRTEGNIARLKRQLEEPLIQFDVSAYNERIRAKTRRIRELEGQIGDILRSQGEHRGQIASRQQEVDENNRRMENLNSQVGRQEEILRKKSPDTAKAWIWLRDNQHLFRSKVYGPAAVECSIKDPQYADAVESLMQNNDFLAFTCTSREDFKILQEQLYGRQRLKNISIRVAAHGLDYFKPPVSDEELRNYGFDSWVIDCISGPEPVLAMLCDSRFFHKAAITLRDHSEQQFERLKESPIQLWIAGRQTYQITRRREYGPGAVTTMVRQVKRAAVWTNQPVDTEFEQRCRQRNIELNGEIQEIRAEFERMQNEILEHRREARSLEEEKRALETEKAAKQKARAEREVLPTKLGNEEFRLRNLRDSGSQVIERILEIDAKVDALNCQKGEVALLYAQRVEMLQKSLVKVYGAQLQLLEAESDVRTMRQQNQNVRELLEQRAGELNTIRQEHKEWLRKARVLQRKALDVHNNATEQEQELHRNFDSASIADLQQAITTTESRIECLEGGNPEIIQQFERRERDIGALENTIQSLEQQLEELNAHIAKIQQKWEPELDELVTQISDAFAYNLSKLGCAGQVQVHKDAEEFHLWAIHILVKFREHEQLSLLDSQRQSGGERSLTTIFYLMAMQSLARAPFRVVDEINQGMDPRNERMVHERMVEIACQEHTSQYFLITPKLLHNLMYHPRMKVHCIASGEYMPKDYKEMDFKRLASVAMRLRHQAKP
ncbi:P-loop containing nucleoside triphosphate hydrolase protein [Lineolata rhizophorae]|uniref:Structural maintenance of chromosomes protein 5 n=1 Tax=Lineolata rhizophorae TaxID=578093 RepID=A0A6A6P3R2_9PEZI|nr:P-loop containing nucleoside triphosphate hydrolase protein [Lineolata rhizophorae]